MSTRNRQPGLSTRLVIERLRITSQHRRLGVLFDEVAVALESGDGKSLSVAFHTFADGLRAHFEIEERVQIPALHGAEPSLESQLHSLVRDHSKFRERLTQIADGLSSGRIDHVGAELRALGRALSEHEEIEESLFSRK